MRWTWDNNGTLPEHELGLGGYPPIKRGLEIPELSYLNEGLSLDIIWDFPWYGSILATIL